MQLKAIPACTLPRMTSDRQSGRHGVRGAGRRFRPVPIALALFASATSAHGQFGARPTVIEGARILTMDGRDLERGTVVVRGGRIDRVEADTVQVRGARRIDASGLVLTPGLIDVASTFLTGDAGWADPAGRMIDAFDGMATRSIEELLAGGVTTLHLSPAPLRGVGPAGGVLRLERDGAAFGRPLRAIATYTIDLRPGERTIDRLGVLDQIRARLRQAKANLDAWTDYEAELAEYIAKLGEEEKEAPAAERPPTPSPAEGGPAPREGGPPGRRPPREGSADAEDAEPDDGDLVEPGTLDDEPPPPPRPRRRPGAGPAGPGGPPPAAEPRGAAARPRTEPGKKPQPPRRDPSLEAMAPALRGEIPVRVRAHESEDILNALEIGAEFGLKIVIEGGAEAGLLADEIAAAGASVVLLPAPEAGGVSDGPWRRAPIDGIERLTRAGVTWSFGSGGGSAARFLLDAAGAVARGACDPLAVVTAQAASALGMTSDVGRIAPGLLADFVLWTGDPREPGSRVAQVWIGGTQVYDAARIGGEAP